MSMSTGGGGADDPIAEINVTPMVDLLLCLLIIFVASAPGKPNQQLPINLPREVPLEQPSDPSATLLVTVDERGATLGRQPLGPGYAAMVEQLKQNPKAQTDGKIIVTGAGAVTYGRVIEVMAAAHEAGIPEVGIGSDRL